jgi:phospholipid/cholesterol/gamma-HCH transport system substrate-binding protein
MPRTRSLAWSELKIGVITIAAIAITAVLIFMLTSGSGLPWQRYSLKARFGNVAGVRSGSPVRLAGVEVGSVQATVLADDQVDVVFEVNRRYESQITSESVATVGSVSLLGESAVDIRPSSKGSPIPEWGYVRSGPPGAQLSDITNQAGEGLDELTALLKDMRQGRGTLGKLMTDEQLFNELNRLIASATGLTNTISHGKGTIGTLLNDPKIANELESTLANIDDVTRRLRQGEGSLGKLMTDDSFSKSLASTTNNIDMLTAKLNRGEGTAGKLLNDSAVYDRLDSITRRIDQLIAQLNEGQGTAGLLLKDKQLYENMNKVVNDLSTVLGDFRLFLADVRKDPKKFLTFKVSIFG